MTLEKTPQSKYQNLIARLISACVALTILFFVLYNFKLNGAMYLILVVSTLISVEFVNLFFSSEKQEDKYFKYALPILVISSLLFTFLQSEEIRTFIFPTLKSLLLDNPSSATLPIYMGLIALPWIYRFQSIQVIFDKLVVYLLVAFYCYLLPIKIFEIFRLDENFYFFGLFAVLVFGTDTLAYFFGKIFGKKIFKQNFQPQISPSKTYEGFIGSLIWPILLISICYYLNIFKFTGLSIVFLYLTSLAAISGDLIASLIKRKSLKKDSGSIFIGHGGFLDRLDSLLLSAPLFLMAHPFIQLVL